LHVGGRDAQYLDLHLYFKIIPFSFSKEGLEESSMKVKVSRRGQRWKKYL